MYTKMIVSCTENLLHCVHCLYSQLALGLHQWDVHHKPQEFNYKTAQFKQQFSGLLNSPSIYIYTHIDIP